MFILFETFFKAIIVTISTIIPLSVFQTSESSNDLTSDKSHTTRRCFKTINQ